MNFLKEEEYKNLDEQTRNSLNYSIADGITWMVFFSLTSGVFLIGFALLLGATPFQIGLISSLPFFANASQIIGAYFIESTGRRKLISLLTASTSRLLWILIILTPLLIFPLENAIWLVIAVFTLSSIFGAISGVAWLSWTSSIVPKDILGKFFGKRNMYMGIAGVAIGLVGGFFLDYWELNQPNLMTAFVILFSIALLFGLASVFYQRRIHTVPKEGENVSFKNFIELAKAPFKDINFRKFVKFGVLWGFAIGIAGPFFIVYMLNTLGLSYVLIVALNTLFIVSGLITLGTWGTIVDRYGAKPVLAICSLIVSLYPFFFIFITKENYFLLVPINILGGIAWAGVDFASVQMLLRTAPQINKSIFFSSFAATTGIAMAIAVIIGGVIAGVFANISYTISIMTLSGLHFLFLITAILRLMSSAMIKDVEEPEAGDVEEVLSHLRQRRLMNIFVNFYHLSQFSIGIVTLPLIYSRRVFKESEQVLRREVGRFRVNSLKTLKELERITKMSMNELRKAKYDDVRKLLPKLNVLNRHVKLLRGKVVTTEDEKVKKVITKDIKKVENEANTIQEKLEISKEVTKIPENYMKKMIRLIRNVV